VSLATVSGTGAPDLPIRRGEKRDRDKYRCSVLAATAGLLPEVDGQFLGDDLVEFLQA